MDESLQTQVLGDLGIPTKVEFFNILRKQVKKANGDNSQRQTYGHKDHHSDEIVAHKIYIPRLIQVHYHYPTNGSGKETYLQVDITELLRIDDVLRPRRIDMSSATPTIVLYDSYINGHSDKVYSNGNHHEILNHLHSIFLDSMFDGIEEAIMDVIPKEHRGIVSKLIKMNKENSENYNQRFNNYHFDRLQPFDVIAGY
ncbi:hypothetical protein GOV08_04410 [Candidatus Woesearchaeota archaeon]|nr:hypothetical protein [Candidatus Woesearchaeota archaeon]